MAKYYLLNENYMLRGWEKLPFAMVDRTTGLSAFLVRDEMALLLDCDGQTDLENADPERRRALDILMKRGVVSASDTPRELLPIQQYRFHHARYIRTAHWSITGRCNYRCKHCYMSAPNAKLGELSHEQIMDIVRQLIECGIYQVSLTGGEPLVRKDFLEIVDALLEGGVVITTIYSNGRLVTDRLLDELDKRGIHPEFNMSFDGTDGWHSWLRGVKDAEKDIDAAFIRCREHGFPTGAEMCLHDMNKHTLRDSVNHLAALGCRSLKTNPIADSGEWKKGGYGESISSDDLLELYCDYIPRYYEDSMPLALMLGGFFSANPARPGEYDIPLFKNNVDPSRVTVCGHARMVLYISPEGRALPCFSLSGSDYQKNYPLITEIGLAKAISDSSYMKLINTRVSEYLMQNPACMKCKYSLQCAGGCRAAALDTTPNNIMGRDMSSCKMFRGGWIERLDSLMRSIDPEIACSANIAALRHGINF